MANVRSTMSRRSADSLWRGGEWRPALRCALDCRAGSSERHERSAVASLRGNLRVAPCSTARTTSDEEGIPGAVPAVETGLVGAEERARRATLHPVRVAACENAGTFHQGAHACRAVACPGAAAWIMNHLSMTSGKSAKRRSAKAARALPVLGSSVSGWAVRERRSGRRRDRSCWSPGREMFRRRSSGPPGQQSPDSRAARCSRARRPRSGGIGRERTVTRFAAPS
jgi:hypothetical protein